MVKKNFMKKIMVFFVIICFVGAGVASAGNQKTNVSPSYTPHFIGIELATKVAQAKLIELEKSGFTLEQVIQIKNNQEVLLCYVFILHPKGYLVVTATKDLPPVIAYSLTNNFESDETTSNVLQEILTADLSFRLENIPLIPIELIDSRHAQWDLFLNEQERSILAEEFQQWPPEGSTTTGGWLETNWQQQSPYNKYVPLDIANGGQRSVAGCPATAMAQILNYHESFNNIRFNDTDDYHHNYGGNNYWIDNDYIAYDFPSFPQLNIYLDTLDTHYEHHTPPTMDDAAALTFACGVAARQVYGAEGSGTFGVNQANTAYLKFNCTTIELLQATDPDVYGRLSKNMIEALPAHLAVVNEGWTSGHNVVVDGYNTDNFFHINFGWGGTYNGWYQLPDDIPYGLTVLEGVIVDIMENHTGPQISCSGSLLWSDITPGQLVTGSFMVKNTGTPGSNLNWEITDYPDWGTWTFTPTNGTDLTPENDPITINVSVDAPIKKNRKYSGYVRVINTDDPTDCYIIPVVLSTPYTHFSPLYLFLQLLFEKFPHLFPILRFFIGR